MRAMTFQPPASTPIRLQQRQLLDGRRQLRDELALIEARARQHADLNPLAWVDWERAARLADAAQEAGATHIGEVLRDESEMGVQVDELLGILQKLRQVFVRSDTLKSTAIPVWQPDTERLLKSTNVCFCHLR